jgi:hypothetical protein
MTASRFPVEAGHIMAFARALGDPSPRFQDALTGAAAPFAPATFVMAAAHFDPDYPLRPGPDGEWFGSGGGPGLALEGGGALHAEQHFEYHRPVRAGDVLHPVTEPGRSWTRQGTRGELVFTELITRFLDADGAPVVTARSVGVQTPLLPNPQGEV